MSAVCTADLTPAVFTVDNAVSIVIMHRNGFEVHSRNGKPNGGGGSFQPRATAAAVSTTGLVLIVSKTGVFLSCVSRTGGTAYRPLPTTTNMQIKHQCIYRHVSNVGSPPGRRLNSGQTFFRLVVINRHVFILHMHTPPIHGRHAPDLIFSTTSV